MSHQDPIIFCRIANLAQHQVLVKLDEDENTGEYHVQIVTWFDFGEVATVIRRTSTDLSKAQRFLEWLDDRRIEQHINGLSEMFGLGKPYEVAA